MRARSLAALPEKWRADRIMQGSLLRRVEAVFRRTVELHVRGGKVELFLFRDDVPLAMLWRSCVLVLSDGLANPLYDGELAGIISHELGHSYSEAEMVAAQREQDERTLRVVELECDAVAPVSVKLLGYELGCYVRGRRRMWEINRRKSLSSGILQSHPELRALAQFTERLLKSLGV